MGRVRLELLQYLNLSSGYFLEYGLYMTYSTL